MINKGIMIFITGDIHAEIDVHKLNNRNFRQGKNLTKEDYLIITGDFGFVWDNSKTDAYWLKWFDTKPYTTLFIDGNHENFDILNTYPVVTWKGGKVHQIKASVFHLLRGEIFSISGKTLFAFGGAHSTDKEQRTESKNWWKEEYPCNAEFEQGINVLTRACWHTDYIITHTCPASILCKIPGLPKLYQEATEINTYFEMINRKTEFRRWYFGHFHQDVEIDNSHTLVYNQILEIS